MWPELRATGSWRGDDSRGRGRVRSYSVGGPRWGVWGLGSVLRAPGSHRSGCRQGCDAGLPKPHSLGLAVLNTVGGHYGHQPCFSDSLYVESENRTFSSMRLSASSVTWSCWTSWLIDSPKSCGTRSLSPSQASLLLSSETTTISHNDDSPCLLDTYYAPY